MFDLFVPEYIIEVIVYRIVRKNSVKPAVTVDNIPKEPVKPQLIKVYQYSTLICSVRL